MNVHIISHVFKQYTNGITLHTPFCNLLDTQHCTLLSAIQNVLVWIYHNPSVHAPPDGQLRGFQGYSHRQCYAKACACLLGHTSDSWEGMTLEVDCRVCAHLHLVRLLSTVTVPINTFSRRVSKFPLFHILSNTWYYEGFKFLPIWWVWKRNL